jgi:1-acyl-sn-glycerol-3-phosphate acyltransferase
LPLRLRFAVRDELFEWVALGRYLKATDQIRVDDPTTRSSLRDMYRQIETSLGSGDSLVVFAQGSILGVEVAFQQGAFRIARRFGIPILPVVVTGSHRVWEHPYTPTVRLDQRISVRVLPALPPAGPVVLWGGWLLESID